MDKLSEIISFNCKSIKRSVEGIREMCRSVDFIALQESWLLPHNLSFLSTISEEFGSTGTSGVNTATGLMTGRPYGGVALLWRKNAFESVSVIECDNVRVCAIKITVRSRSVVNFSVYMPTNSYDNLPEFCECLCTIRAVKEIEETMGIEAFYILGDFNAHPGELFYNEMLDFVAQRNKLV